MAQLQRVAFVALLLLILPSAACAVPQTSLVYNLEVNGKKERNLRYRLKLAKYELQWPKADYAIFTFVDSSPRAGLRLTYVVPRIGDSIWSVMGPVGMSPFLVSGIYSGRAGYADGKSVIDGMYLVATPGTYGASGSPVFDRFGRVWGIYVGGNDELQGMGLVVLVPRL
jgi:hypothetical protein